MVITVSTRNRVASKIARGFESHRLRQQKENFCLPKVLFLFIPAAGLAYHHDAVVDIIKGGKPPLYLITRQRASSCGLMIYNTSC